MTTAIETELRLTHSTAYFRVWKGQPEMLLEHGCDAGAACIVGRAELEAVAEHLRLLLQTLTPTSPPNPPPEGSHTSAPSAGYSTP